MSGLLIPPAAQQAVSYQKTEFPAVFADLPIGVFFTTPAIPKCKFRKSTDNRGECVTKGLEHKSQFFHDNAGVVPVGWEKPVPVVEPDIYEDSEGADGCGTVADGDAVASAAASPGAAGAMNPGQRTVAGKSGPQGQGAARTLARPQTSQPQQSSQNPNASDI